ncbi:hypothetical protein CHRY9390_00269 [Chryseobacterium aquaeductus]|uniref:DUF3575 domain-containing protein n=1 Tax=Chryseobacterium aquaeductus TaxID=2675056 RepID=A0A9N8MD68_9FLAO|nr:DUF3575 domain-containing protein [Chryseobacterium aquaeductus]CAA7329629.1 hypothetical protein CHRY9390_00269 [Chryseobacterium potabilaquae]CAD7798030.1 hypothetical protein CHRY9390_00269 [Chryseobacterium aquaeductus]
MRNKIIIAALGLFSFLNINAQETPNQENPVESKKKLYLKGNALLIPIGVINAGLEYQLSNKFTLQGDILISPWKSFAGHEAQIYMGTIEGRYYFKEAFKGWHIGANISVGAFNIQKPSYWNDNTYVDAQVGIPSQYINSQLYQKGFSFLFGVEGGYQFRLADKWNMDIFAGIGNSQDFYKGYVRGTGERYDSADGYNRSSEWLPYRGGVMISYRLK